MMGEWRSGYSRRFLDICWPVTTDPAIDMAFVSHAATEQFVDGDTEPSSFEVPERNVDAGQGTHEHLVESTKSAPTRGDDTSK